MQERIRTEIDELGTFMAMVFSVEPSEQESPDYIKGFYESQIEIAMSMVKRCRRIVYQATEEKK